MGGKSDYKMKDCVEENIEKILVTMNKTFRKLKMFPNLAMIHQGLSYILKNIRYLNSWKIYSFAMYISVLIIL